MKVRAECSAYSFKDIFKKILYQNEVHLLKFLTFGELQNDIRFFLLILFLSQFNILKDIKYCFNLFALTVKTVIISTWNMILIL